MGSWNTKNLKENEVTKPVLAKNSKNIDTSQIQSANSKINKVQIKEQKKDINEENSNPKEIPPPKIEIDKNSNSISMMKREKTSEITNNNPEIVNSLNNTNLQNDLKESE